MEGWQIAVVSYLLVVIHFSFFELILGKRCDWSNHVKLTEKAKVEMKRRSFSFLLKRTSE